MAQQLKALSAIAEDQSSLSSTHIAAHNSSLPLVASLGTASVWCTTHTVAQNIHIHRQNTHIHKMKINFKRNLF